MAVEPTKSAVPVRTDSDDFIPRYLDPVDVRLFRSPHGSPRLEIKGVASYLRVAFRRIRPLSDPDHYISVWSDDDTEIGVIRDPSQLDDESLSILNEELDVRYFTPTIHRIFSVKTQFGVHEWRVDTSRGEMSFSVRGLNQHVRQMPPSRLLITDVRGNRYDIPDVGALDAHSYDQIQRHL